MGDRKESSLTFSLQELKAHEAKVEAERRAAVKRREEAARAAQLERARLIRQAATDEREREERRRVEHERERLDEIARRAAVERATVERERIEAQARVNSEREREQRRHELELARVGTARATRAAVVFSACATVATLAVCSGLYFGLLVPAHATALASARETATTERDRADTAERVLGSLKQERKLLIQKVAEISYELDQAKHREAKPVPVTPAGPIRRPGPGVPAPTNGICDPNADPDDPIGCGRRH